MAEALEGRRHVRFVVHVPIYIGDGEAIVRKTVRLVSRDISEGGLSFETSRELPLDATSRVVISSLGDIPGPILIRGRVAWKRPQVANGRYLVGVEFTDFENVTRDRLLAEIEAWPV